MSAPKPILKAAAYLAELLIKSSGEAHGSPENVGALGILQGPTDQPVPDDRDYEADAPARRKAEGQAALLRAKVASFVRAFLGRRGAVPGANPGLGEHDVINDDPDFVRTMLANADPRTIGLGLKRGVWESWDGSIKSADAKLPVFKMPSSKARKAGGVGQAIEATNPFNMPKIPRGLQELDPMAKDAPDSADAYDNDLEVTAALIRRVFRL